MGDLCIRIQGTVVEFAELGDMTLVGPKDEHEKHHWAVLRGGRILCGPRNLDRTDWLVSRYEASERHRLGYVCQKAMERAANVLSTASESIESELMAQGKRDG